MEFQVLGPVTVQVGGRALATGRPQQAAVLAALVVDCGRVVSVDALVDRVWDDEPPPQVRRTVQTHIARIRRLLHEADPGVAGPPLLRRPGGYLLDVDRDQVDLHRFGRLTTQARTARGVPARQAALLHEALGLWRGEPLSGVAGQWAQRSREAWRRHHLDAAVAWAHAELSQGDPAAVIGQLSTLAVEYPLAESLIEVLMRALAGAGRPAEALDRYAALRRQLAEHLGVDPAAEVERTHQAILRGETAPAPAGPAPAGPVAAQLPADVRGFVGREAEIARLDAILAGAERQPAVAIVVLSGTAGVGKTALAVNWAYRISHRFPDGQLYLNLRGFAPGAEPVTADEALRGFLAALGVAPERVPAGVDAQAGLYRSLLAERRMLIVLDNARNAEHVRPLLPGSPGCLALLTSRSRLSGLIAVEGAQSLRLDLLTAPEARDLLASRLGPARVAAEPAAAAGIVASCARLPLALTIAAAHAAANPDFPLSHLAGELSRATGGLEAFHDDEAVTDLRAVFSWSYRQLSAPAARLFRLLSLHPGADIAAGAAGSLAGEPGISARRLLAELDRAQLVSQPAPGRYGCHDLLRAYARELVLAHDTGPERDAALLRTLDHYLHTAVAAALLLEPHREPIHPDPAAPAVVPDALADHREAPGSPPSIRPCCRPSRAPPRAGTTRTPGSWRGR